MSHDALSVVCELQGKANVFSKKANVSAYNDKSLP
jgi:hypothetical protein